MKTWIVTVILTDDGDQDDPEEPYYMDRQDIVRDVTKALRDKMPTGIEVQEVTTEEE